MNSCFSLLHTLTARCATLPLCAAVLLLASERFTQSPERETASGLVATLRASAPIDPDLAIIDGVLAKRAPDLGLTLRTQLTKAITEESVRAEFDPLLVLAIIDVESDFSEGAISNKGARGLMQIKPSTLHFWAQKEGIRLSREEIAADAALCVRLGIRYLKALQTRFGGDLDLALMAYNAGPARVRQAIRDRELENYRRYPRLVRRDFRRFREGEGLVGDWALALRDISPGN